MGREESALVYSTDTGTVRPCAACKERPCRCAPAKSLPAQQQTAAIHYEKKGRGGKAVSIVRGLQLAPADLKALAKDLKNTCGTGGTIKDGSIEIQGNQRDRIAGRLQALGYKTKFVGG